MCAQSLLVEFISGKVILLTLVLECGTSDDTSNIVMPYITVIDCSLTNYTEVK